MASVSVKSQKEFIDAVASGASIISLENDILYGQDCVSPSISINFVKSIEVQGNGFKLDAAGCIGGPLLYFKQSIGVVIKNLIITNKLNTDSSYGSTSGGGLKIDTSIVTLIGCIITKNTAVSGGGISISLQFSGSTEVTLISCVISQNYASNAQGNTDDDGYYDGGGDLGASFNL